MNVEETIKSGNDAYNCGQTEQAEQLFLSALQSAPENCEALLGLSKVYSRKQNHQSAAEVLEKACAISPHNQPCQFSLGTTYLYMQDYEKAKKHLKSSISLNPSHSPSHNNLGSIYIQEGQLSKAEYHCQKAIAHNRNYPGSYSNLAKIYCDRGFPEKAIDLYRAALKIDPEFTAAWSNLLLTTLYHPQMKQEEVFSEHSRWGDYWEKKLTREPISFVNNTDPERPLRVGYLSAEFRHHSVDFFLDPIICNHDRSKYQTYCYSDLHPSHEDRMTERIKKHAYRWIPVYGISDQALAERIREDRIDILLELSGHTANNRLFVYARKPAPIQVTYLAYPNTTGLTAIDYRLTNHYCDPPGQEAYYREKMFRMEGPFQAYQPPPGVPEVGPLPAEKNGFITFGSFNNLPKLNEDVISLWADILKEIPKSKLVLKAAQLYDKETQTLISKRFARYSIEKHRIQYLLQTASTTDHLDTYNKIDIALDPFPFNGATTTCEALLMGVPVITLAGTFHAGRVAGNILHELGLKSFIAANRHAYIGIAQYISKNLKNLSDLRVHLRNAFLASPLCDHSGFTRKMESAYRIMWETWCKNQKNR